MLARRNEFLREKVVLNSCAFSVFADHELHYRGGVGRGRGVGRGLGVALGVALGVTLGVGVGVGP